MITRDEAIEALECVHDAHVPVSLRRMGMLGDVTVDTEGRVEVQMCLPCMACPAISHLSTRIEQALEGRDGVTSVAVTPAWHLQWERDSVDPDARALMRAHGIQL